MSKRTVARFIMVCALLIGAPKVRGETRTPATHSNAVPGPRAVLERADARRALQLVNFPQRPEPVGEGGDRTLSPYFYVDTGDASTTERLPLKETRAEVQIAGVIASVRIHQVFENTGAKPIEAVYVFPGSTRAAVHGMRMKIGERTVEAEIERKQSAREQYEQAKQEGKRASLLEQQRANVFTMNVANIMPRDRIVVQLDYSELLVPTDAVYEFVLPTVVGPRYGGGADPSKDKWIENPYLTEGTPEPYAFDVKAHLETAIPLKELTSPSHEIAVDYLSTRSADVKLRQPGGGNKDFVLRFRLAGDKIESGVLLYEGQEEKFFLMMMEPPRRPTPKQIPAREFVFLLDVSGSMGGFPLETSKALMRDLLAQMRPTDLFNLVFFAGASYVLSPTGSLPATKENVERAWSAFSTMQGGGGTELMSGLEKAYGIPKPKAPASRTVVVATDGYVGIEARAFKFIRERLGEANLFAFGIGTSVNRGLIEGMARAGQGEPFVVLKPDRAGAEASRFGEYVQEPVLSHIQFAFEGFDAVEVAPGKLADLLARRPLVLFGKYRGETSGTVTVRGLSGDGPIKQTLRIEPASVSAQNAPLRWLWARKWVEILDDEMALGADKEIEVAITDLGLSYSLLTSFTSFVAIDSEVANRQKSVETVNQPLPLPEGVSNSAVGGAPGDASNAARTAPRKMQAPRQMARLRERNDFNNVTLEGELTKPEGSYLLNKKAEPLGSLIINRSEMPVEGTQAKNVVPAATADLRAIAFTVVRNEAQGLSDPAALLEAIEERLQSPANVCQREIGKIVLKLSVDAEGHVTKVDVVSARDPSQGTCLARLLEQLQSATRALGESGTLTVEIKAI